MIGLGSTRSRKRSDVVAKQVLVLNGPNLNMLGTRQPEVYGHATLADVVTLCEKTGAEHGLTVRAEQSNHEGQIIDWIHEARGVASGIVINPGGLTHTSVALRDALVIPEVPIIEVHISNVHAREEFRHHSFVSPIASGVIAGLGIDGYRFAIQRLASLV
ncbi:type II 3-dehydroquinate dehydratase [Rhodococcus sp. 15-725-2-2b]|uniref:type II 3-dehydroquinate dehydratase n=1 Tax=Nocardiaceae TaxID=85025 RepID=UPI0005EBE823|nr:MULTISPECIES: type II 3-dehydroquinate dehydratase [Rhodococcus]OZC59041.1 type II 3-dehydroquinate dehydratase [Rhodococcus sp. 06-470-2]OZC66413.1 type II 3-dehydroquinate dehydratase [Rhodococcus sp. 06-469-3-2]OZC73090.1 type II 3-dehydroquinate dehydratase [Rhodococcus sp. 06-418-5]OZD45060.1 type II 3-dehydroquinate dehydratase [Rhodococcus sp. 06-1477-1A]OZD84001.1 type II 3-dehydroquinate dehydratase [Rhodococcus sp. 05-339-2]